MNSFITVVVVIVVVVVVAAMSHHIVAAFDGVVEKIIKFSFVGFPR